MGNAPGGTAPMTGAASGGIAPITGTAPMTGTASGGNAQSPASVPAPLENLQLAPASAPKDGVPADARAELPPRLVWRLAPGAARMSDGWQTWRFLPDKKLNRFYPAGTWTIAVTAKGANGQTITQYSSFELRRETRLASVRAEKSAGADGVRLRGSLTRVDPRGLTDYGPFGKQRLEVLWRQDPSATWERAGETTTDAAGAFVSTVQGRTGGYWRVRFPGTGHYASDISKSRQIAQ